MLNLLGLDALWMTVLGPLHWFIHSAIILNAFYVLNNVMGNFICQFGWAQGCPDSW